MFNIINSRIKLNSQKFIADFELSKFLEQSIPVLIGTFIFFNPFAHTTAIKEICYYSSVFFTIILICSRKIKFDFKNPLILPFGLFVFWAFIGLLFAIDKKNSIHDFYSHLLRYIILYYIIINFFNSNRRLSRLSWIIIISTTISSLGSLIYYYFILGFKLSSRIGVGALPQTGLNIISILAFFAIMLSFYQLLIEKKIYRRIVFVFCIFVLLTTVIFTQSKSAWFAIFFACIPLFQKHKKNFLVFIIIMLIIFVIAPIKKRFSFNKLLNSSRIAISLMAIEVIKDHPIVGIGFGMQTYEKLDLKKYKERLAPKYQDRIITDPHNILLDIAVRLGIVGLVLFFYIIFVYCKMGWEIIKYGKGDFLKNWGRCLASAFIAVFIIGLFQPIFSHVPEVVICTIFSMTTIVWRLNNEPISNFNLFTTL